MTRRLLQFIMVVGAGLLAGTGAAIAFSGHAGASRNRVTHVREATAVDPRLVAKMKIFRVVRSRAASAAGLPDTSIGTPTGDVISAAGANVTLAQEVSTQAGNIFIVPGQNSVCGIGPGFGGCGSLSQLGTIGFSTVGKAGTDPTGTERVLGIVPDDVQTLTAVLDGGGTLAIPVQDNAFGAVVRGSVTTLIYHTTTGEVDQHFTPLDAPAKLWQEQHASQQSG